MKISELIQLLTNLKNKNGDLNVCTSESHEYWGSIENYVTIEGVYVNENALPKGPKSGLIEKVVIIS